MNDMRLYLAIRRFFELMEYFMGAVENWKNPDLPTPEEYDVANEIMLDILGAVSNEDFQAFLLDKYERLEIELGIDGDTLQ